MKHWFYNGRTYFKHRSKVHGSYRGYRVPRWKIKRIAKDLKWHKRRSYDDPRSL